MADHDDCHRDCFWPGHRDGYDLNTRIMLTAIISLSVVVVLVIALHLYVRCVLRRQARRRTFIRQLGIGAAAQVHSSEPPKTGLDPSVIATLPTFVFRRGKSDDDSGSTECPVCLGAVEDGETARLLPNCKHSFHMACIDKWLSSQSTCPVCRADAQPREQPEAAPATAPPLEQVNSAVVSVEGTSEGEVGPGPSAKVTGSTSRLSSFRRMLSRERSSRRNQSCGLEDGVEEFERV